MNNGTLRPTTAVLTPNYSLFVYKGNTEQRLREITAAIGEGLYVTDA